MISDATNVPKHYRISQQIIAAIRSARLKPGVQISSENEIIRKYGVSNTIVRRSLQEIKRTRWGTRIKGECTFVRKRNVQRSATRLLGFTRNMIETGYSPSTKVLDARKITKGYSGSINRRRYFMRARWIRYSASGSRMILP